MKGRAEALAGLTSADRARFDLHVRKQGDADACWIWVGKIDREGYGEFCAKGVCVRAHRAAFAFENGSPPGPGLVIRHRCDTPGCVNPRHLEAGTPKDNTQDMIMRGRASFPAWGPNPKAKGPRLSPRKRKQKVDPGPMPPPLAPERQAAVRGYARVMKLTPEEIAFRMSVDVRLVQQVLSADPRS